MCLQKETILRDSLTREDLASDVVMVFSEHGNAYASFDYTPEALEDQARTLRAALGESTVVSYGPSPFVVDAA